MSTTRNSKRSKATTLTALADIERANWRASWPERFMRIMYELTALPAEQGVSIKHELRRVTADGVIHIKIGWDEWADDLILGPDSPQWEIDQIADAIQEAVAAKNERERIARIAREAKALLTDEQLDALGLRR